MQQTQTGRRFPSLFAGGDLSQVFVLPDHALVSWIWPSVSQEEDSQRSSINRVVLALGPDHYGFLYIFLFSTKVSLTLCKYTTTELRASVLLTFVVFQTGSYYSINWHSTRDLPASASQEAGIVDLCHQACLYMCVCVGVRAVPK